MPSLTWFSDLEYWLVDEPALSRAVLTDDRFSSSTLNTSFSRFSSGHIHQECAYLLDILRRWYVEHDPPQHTAERRVTQAHFSRGLLTRLGPAINDIVDETLDALSARTGGVDAVRDIAEPVSARVIGLALGLQRLDISQLHRWSADIAAFVSAVYRLDLARKAQQAVLEMADFIRQELTGQAAEGLAGRYQDGDFLAGVADHTMMLFGGLETSARLLGLALWELLCTSDRAAVEVEEIIDRVLRRYPPLKYVSRVAAADIELADRRIRAGELVMVSLTGAEDVATPALAFGMGRHFCLGMPLTMLETTILLNAFQRRFPDAALAAPNAEPSGNHAYHGFHRLPLVL
ncbi:hypothetical protein ACFHYQ_03910 [Sphaerimonospora cavernae]|uniref:Cytochrome P450 n=1 Tax=Sphaerimonospora cavernae TaxID=1740611 RepID=A0ABV6TYZ8_9ACTN